MSKLALLSLSNDLKRITHFIQRGSFENSKRFQKEARKWIKESNKIEDEYVRKLIKKVEITLKQKDDLNKAEDCLMYSVLLQNQAIHGKK